MEPLISVPEKTDGTRITVNYQKLSKVAGISRITNPHVDEGFDTLRGGSVLFKETKSLSIESSERSLSSMDKLFVS